MIEISPRDFEPNVPDVQAAPRDNGLLELIVLRPAVDVREIVMDGQLDLSVGLVGDSWIARGSASTPDGSASPERQLTLMNVRVLKAIEPDPARWPLAGDQLYVDLDLSIENLPAGTHWAIGSAVIEISEPPHTGCAKFSARFGSDALRWINSPTGRALRMRGLNARIVTPGAIRTGDTIRRVTE